MAWWRAWRSWGWTTLGDLHPLHRRRPLFRAMLLDLPSEDVG
ncbi:hypothetical protein ACIHCV_37910 [Streptomyces sp. NPDC051956]